MSQPPQVTRPGFNDLIPCPSDTSRRRHTALAQHCPICGTDGRRMPLPTLAEIIQRRRLAGEAAA